MEQKVFRTCGIGVPYSHNHANIFLPLMAVTCQQHLSSRSVIVHVYPFRKNTLASGMEGIASVRAAPHIDFRNVLRFISLYPVLSLWR